jgi:AlkA N-terminal domain
VGGSRGDGGEVTHDGALDEHNRPDFGDDRPDLGDSDVDFGDNAFDVGPKVLELAFEVPELVLKVLQAAADYRPPLDWEAMLSFLAAHATPDVERVFGAAYHRALRVGDAVGFITVSRDPKRAALRAEVSASLVGKLRPLVGKLRALFDLDAHPRAIADHLAQDPALAEASRTLRNASARLNKTPSAPC